ncbi:flavodoxin domain-containing protein [Anaerotignum sp. MB30-C6]|uniref:flavodoxin domain-containing protein n=1 Tax=Anaerotignum sp. MB30-C6 TaxID=3070814 RepID=UPI0027DB6CD3|nr:flavodoxin domain-containing protein [Anaerotignum sp. MB30-C6]WMI81114.1 flavodoxin domain-containing protein [Anaerotignum sp. MB30-C6]
MGKTAVVYRSEYGSTKRYANYIGEKIQADILSTDEAKDISSYETIIYGGGIYAGAINGSDWLKKNQEAICNKKFILFTCSLSNPHKEENIQAIQNGLKQSLTEELVGHAKVFFFPGALDFKKLKFTHKGLLTVLFQYLKHKKQRSAEEEGMLKCREMPMDFVDTSEAEALISFAKE